MGSVVLADICGEFLRPSILIGSPEPSLRGESARVPTSHLRSRGFRTTVRRVFFSWAAALCACAASAAAFPEVPKEAVDALGVTRGKPIRTGIVFVSGMMLEPPYVVKRVGTGVFVQDGNRKDHQVTGQVRNWKRFLATQGGVGAGADEEDVDDFFDDEKPAAKQVSAAKPVPETGRPVTESASGSGKPAVTVSDNPPASAGGEERPVPSAATESGAVPGPFKENARSRMLLRPINDVRLRFDKSLRLGAGLFFSPSRRLLQLDSRTSIAALEAIVGALKSAGDVSEMEQALRSKGITIFGVDECREFLAHRRLLPQMEERLERMRKEAATSRLLSGSSL